MISTLKAVTVTATIIHTVTRYRPDGRVMQTRKIVVTRAKQGKKSYPKTPSSSRRD